MDTFFSILTSFFPNEKKKFLHHAKTYHKHSAFTFLRPSTIDPSQSSSFDILNYYFISEMYVYTIPIQNNNYSYITNNYYSTRRRRRRDLYFDNPALAKYEALKNTILDNIFIGQQKKDEILDIFCKSQRAYFGFCHLARLFKRKHTKPNPISTDMCFNSLLDLKSSILIDVYDDQTRTMYTFRISDIINIINTSLMHSPHFFSDPQYIKNPYTNIPFTKAQLYNLYFGIRSSPFIMPLLFHFFFLTKFSLSTFSMKHECHIREEAIANFERNATKNIKLVYINQMLYYHKIDMENISIHPDIPDELLLDTFSSYLYDYLIALYSLQPECKIEAYARIKERLYEFSISNPHFGKINNCISKKKRIFTLPQVVAGEPGAGAGAGTGAITFSFTNKEQFNADGKFVFNCHSKTSIV